LYFWGECPKSGGGFQPPRSGWKPLPLCAAKLREGHTSKVRPKGAKFSRVIELIRFWRLFVVSAQKEGVLADSQHKARFLKFVRDGKRCCHFDRREKSLAPGIIEFPRIIE